jgi:hypothetical protein
MLRIAFKEWSAVCGALAAGRQSLIIRKGGIAEEGGQFKPEYDRFWLYPTFLHQQQGGTKPEAEAFLRAVRPPEGTIRFRNFVDVAEIFQVRSLEAALALDDLHVWTAATIRQRFHYRSPGLYVLAVRVFQVPAVDLPEHPAYAGCKTWVDLDRGLPTDGAEAVLTHADFAEQLARIREPLGSDSVIGEPPA